MLARERVRVRELPDAVVAHALGELHRLLMIGGGVVAGAGRCARTNPRRSRRAWQGRPAAVVFYSWFLPACGDCVDTGSPSSRQLSARPGLRKHTASSSPGV